MFSNYSIILSTCFTVLVASGSATASTIDLEFVNSAPTTSTVGTDYVSVQTSGFNVTTRGYVSEILGSTDTVKGAFEAHDFRTCANRNICGATRTFGLHYYDGGFGLLAGDTATVDVSGVERGGGLYVPGFNGYYVDLETPGLLISQFASFSFDKAVDIGGVIVDDVSNHSRNIWMAYSENEIDLSAGLGSALSSLTVINSSDDASDGLFTHALNGANIKTLLVGSPISGGTYAGINSGGAQFYIRGFGEIGLSASAGGSTSGEISPVPLPATGLLLLAGFGAFAVTRRSGVVAPI